MGLLKSLFDKSRYINKTADDRKAILAIQTELAEKIIKRSEKREKRIRDIPIHFEDRRQMA